MCIRDSPCWFLKFSVVRSNTETIRATVSQPFERWYIKEFGLEATFKVTKQRRGYAPSSFSYFVYFYKRQREDILLYYLVDVLKLIVSRLQWIVFL